MAPTNAALLSQNHTQTGTTLVSAFPEVTPNGIGGGQHLDLFQVIGIGGSVLLNVDYQGNVHKPASGVTNGTRIGQFQTRLTSSATTQQILADAFTNPSGLDIIQTVSYGGSVNFYHDKQGTSHGS